MRVEVPPLVHRLGDDVHLLAELAEVLEVGALTRPDVPLNKDSEGPRSGRVAGGAGRLEERLSGSGERSFLYHRQNFGHGL